MIGEAGAQAGGALLVDVGGVGIGVVGEVVDLDGGSAKPGLEPGDIGAGFFELGRNGEWRVCAVDDLLAAEMLHVLALEREAREVLVDCIVVWHGISSVGLPSTPCQGAGGVLESAQRFVFGRPTLCLAAGWVFCWEWANSWLARTGRRNYSMVGTRARRAVEWDAGGGWDVEIDYVCTEDTGLVASSIDKPSNA